MASGFIGIFNFGLGVPAVTPPVGGWVDLSYTLAIVSSSVSTEEVNTPNSGDDARGSQSRLTSRTLTNRGSRRREL